MTPLQTELSKPEYAGLSDAEAAARLNAPIDGGYTRLVSVTDIMSLLIHSGELPAIGAKSITSSDPLFGICYCVTEYFRTHEYLSLDASTSDGSKALEMLAACCQANLIGAASRAAVMALAQATTTRAAMLHLPTPLPTFAVAIAKKKVQ